MADGTLTVDRKTWLAGADYLKALRHLGLEPEVLAWGFFGPEARTELVLVTSWIDSVGPKALYDLLFEAYDAAATPRGIDPFIVSVYSPKTVLGEELSNLIEQSSANSKLLAPSGALFLLGRADILIPGDMIYTARRSHRSKVDELRRFKRFERQVHAIAA